MRAVLAQTLVELRLSARRGEAVLITLVIPPVLLAFMGTVTPVTTAVGQPLDFLVTGIIALAVISTSMVSLGIATGFERYYGVLKRLGGTPFPRLGLLAAKMSAVTVIEGVQMVLIAAVAVTVLAWRPTGSWLVAIPALAVGTLCFASVGLLLAGALRAEATLAIANGLYLAFILVGDVIIPAAQLPAWLQPVAAALPSAALAGALRAALTDGTWVPALPWLLIWTAISTSAAVKFFRWE
jgi:ABC-2 type transport system permease protein